MSDHDSTAVLSLSTGLLVTLLVVWSTLGHSLASRCNYVTEGSLACGLGLVAGLLLLSFRGWLSNGLVADLLAFNSASFFTYLLPPVIFYAGLSVEKRLLFANLPSILSLGVLGTLISFVVISLSLYLLTASQLHLQDCLALGAIFSATDSVATLQVLSQDSMPLLFSLCFGEGIVNDATSVVLLAAVKHFTTPRVIPQLSPPPPLSPPPLEATTAPGVIAAGIKGFMNMFLNETTPVINSSPLTPPPSSNTHPHPSAAIADSPLAAAAAFLAATAADTAVAPTAGDIATAPAAIALTNTSVLSPPSLPPLPPEVVDTSAAALGNFSYSLLTGFTSMLFFSLSLGCVAGLGIAVLLSSQTQARGAHHEVAVVGLLSYLTYLAAEMFGLSSILALFVCGLTVSHVALPTMSPTGRATTLTTFNTLSHLSEGIIFIYVGLDSLDPAKWNASYPVESMWLLLVMCGVLLGARACAVIPLTLLHNAWSGQKLRTRDKLVMWWSGLMRGSVSVALVYWYFDNSSSSSSTGSDSGSGAPLSVLERRHATLIVTTLATVLVSIMVVGALTKPFLHMAMTEQAPLQVVAAAPSHALAAVVAAARIGAGRMNLALAKLRHFAAQRQHGSDTGEDGDMVALLPISSHPQQQQQPYQSNGSSSLELEQHLHQTLTHNRLSVLHNNMAANNGRHSSASASASNSTLSGPHLVGRSTSPQAQEPKTISPRSTNSSIRQGGPLFTTHSVSAVPSNSSIPSSSPFPAVGSRVQPAPHGASTSSPLPRGNQATSPPANATSGRRAGACSSSFSDGYCPTEAGQGRAGCNPDSPKGFVRDTGPARQRNEREGERQASKDLLVARKTSTKSQSIPHVLMDSSSEPPS